MKAPAPAALRVVLVGTAVVVLAVSATALRLADLPIYLTFAALSLLALFPTVEVMPGMPVPLPQLATTIGFVYVGGPPIVLLVAILHAGVALGVPRLWRVIPHSWRPLLAAPSGNLLERPFRLEYITDWAVFCIGLWLRWQVASLVSGGAPPFTDTGAIAVGEIAGYAFWAGLTRSNVFSFGRPSPPLSLAIDLGLVMVLALTPFVFLIAYGYRLHGITGAAGWALGSFGLHFLLQRLTQRRLTVEEQNRRLQALNRELEHRERLSAIGKMSSVVSHQILQQLGVIGVYADLIRNAGADDAVQVRANAGAIEQALGEVNRVLRDLLVFSKDLRLNLYDHALAGIVADAVAGCGPRAEARCVRLRVSGDGDARLVVDKLKMQQAVANVVANAIDASPEGGEVTVDAAVRDGWAEITVRDHGPGVPAADQPRLFTPFFTTKEHGTGLGLAITHEFTTAHGGEVRIARPPGGGAAFTLRLPQAGPPAPDDGSAPATSA